MKNILILLLSIATLQAAHAANFPIGQPAKPSAPLDKHTLRVINQCSYPIWIHTEGRINNQLQQNDSKLEPENAFDYTIPPEGAHATLTKASAGCDNAGKNCAIGSDNVDTRFEVDWFTIAKSNNKLVPNLSAVEGYTFPVKVDYILNGIPQTQDCGKLSLAECPSNFEDHLGSFFQERIIKNGQIVGCYPNKKISIKDHNQFEKNNDYQYYGCPTPPVSVSTCRQNYGADPDDSTKISNETPAFVQYLHNYGKYNGQLDNSCRMYGYAYDDTFGTPHSDPDQPIILTYCPDPKNVPSLPN